jgi:hypothetical protein
MPYKTFKVEVDDGGHTDPPGPAASAARGGPATPPPGVRTAELNLDDLKAALSAKLGRSAKAMLGAMEKQASSPDALAAMIQATLTQLGA